VINTPLFRGAPFRFRIFLAVLVGVDRAHDDSSRIFTDPDFVAEMDALTVGIFHRAYFAKGFDQYPIKLRRTWTGVFTRPGASRDKDVDGRA
jgi:hypothetical protein